MLYQSIRIDNKFKIGDVCTSIYYLILNYYKCYLYLILGLLDYI